MIKLKTLLKEAPGDIKTVADSSLSQTVSLLQKLSTDKDFQDILQKGLEDGDISDEKIKFGKGTPKASEMRATQAEIGFSNSVDDAIISRPWASAVERAFSNPVLMPSQPDKVPVLAASIGGKIYILDGHHRWSLCLMINPDANMVCDIMYLDQGTAEDALKIMQMAIAAKAGKIKTKNFEGDDLMATSRDKLEQHVINNIDEGRVAEWSKYTNGELTTPEDIANHMGNGLDIIKGLKGEFPRTIMPQADFSGAPQDDVNKTLAKGQINFKEPFGESIIDVERWKQIANIKKK